MNLPTKNKNILKSFSYYTVSNAIVAFFMFLLIPIMTRMLDATNLGYIFLFQSILSIFFIIIGLGSQSVIQTLYHKAKEDIDSYISSAICNSLIVWLVLCIIVYFNTEYFFFLFNIYHPIVFIASILAVFFFLQNLTQGILQTMENPSAYSFVTILSAFIAFLITIIYLYAVDISLYARIWGISAGLFFSFIVSFYFLRTFNITSPHFSKMKELCIIGLPVVIHSVSMLMINQTDKILIGSLLDASSVGTFGVPAQLASAITLIGSGISMGFAPRLYKSLSSGMNDYKKIIKIRNIAMFSLFILSVIFSLTIFYLSDFILGKQFIFDFKVFLMLIAAYLLFSFYHFFSCYFYYFNKTRTLSAITISIAILNLILSLYLIPRLGILGASLGTLMSYFFGLLVAIMFSTNFINHNMDNLTHDN